VKPATFCLNCGSHPANSYRQRVPPAWPICHKHAPHCAGVPLPSRVFASRRTDAGPNVFVPPFCRTTDGRRTLASCFNTGEQFIFGTRGLLPQSGEPAGCAKQHGKAQGKGVDALGGLRAGIARKDSRSIASVRIDFSDAFRPRWARMGDSCRYLKGRILPSQTLLKLACCARTFDELSGESGGCGPWRELYRYC
jgi:hypothetical protein